MSDLKELERIMLDMGKRLETNPNDQEARAIFDRTSELLRSIWKDGAQ